MIYEFFYIFVKKKYILTKIVKINFTRPLTIIFSRIKLPGAIAKKMPLTRAKFAIANFQLDTSNQAGDKNCDNNRLFSIFSVFFDLIAKNEKGC